MSEYIEQERIYQHIAKGESICKTCYHRNVCRGIGNQPCIKCNQHKNAADVVEVKHGRWTKEYDPVLDRSYWSCSECKEWAYSASNHCPNCGAKMDGEA